MITRNLGAATALAVALAAPVVAAPTIAAAQEGPAYHVGWTVYLHATGFADGIMTTDQELDMGIIAFQAAAARVCTDYEIDQPKLSAAVEGLEHVNLEDLSGAEAEYTQQLRTMVIGIAIGGFIAEFAVAPDEFCGSVDEYIETAGEDALLAKR